MGASYKIPIILDELSGINRIDEPVTGGIPIKKGLLFDTKNICLINQNKIIPVQTQILSRWSDGSIKWLLLDFKTSLNAKEKKKFFLIKKRIKKIKDIEISKDMLGLLEGLILVDNKNKKHCAVIKKTEVETKGSQRTVVKLDGGFKNSILQFFARFNFYPNNKLRLDLTIRNPQAAKHPGGFWDLGDRGSVLFKDLFLRIKMVGEGDVYYKNNPKSKFKKTEDVIIYQDSSDNKNWKHHTHVNRYNQVMHVFKGYNVYEKGNEVLQSAHTQPTVKVGRISVALKDFWQNFPKTIEANKNEIVIRLFPKQYADFHELQGGEQKTHSIFFDFDGNDLDWIQYPLVVASTPEYYSETGAIPYLTPETKADRRYHKLIYCAIKGQDSFDKKNKIIDEYGWRNFGEIYADHEAVHEKDWFLIIIINMTLFMECYYNFLEVVI
ncbi:MAG: hypothetical protein NC935_06370 [Candidatus Omnitrophica bacterium]|nr:hypothetical protein [Candidatus Omnitrophota bacterium]